MSIHGLKKSHVFALSSKHVRHCMHAQLTEHTISLCIPQLKRAYRPMKRPKKQTKMTATLRDTQEAWAQESILLVFKSVLGSLVTDTPIYDWLGGN